MLAGEPSGDIIGARLIRALRRRRGDGFELFGIGGPRMIEQGVRSLFPMDELSLMGFAEIVPHLPNLIHRLRQTGQEIRRIKPDVVLTIDAPSFSLRVQDRIRDLPALRVHYVAPQVWAWREGRAAKLARKIDHLLALFPFEPPFFERRGLSCSFVGHPIIEDAGRQGDGARFRRRYELPTDAPVICLLPGSRMGEISRHMPVLGDAVVRLWQRFPRLRLILPTLPPLVPAIRSAVGGWPLTPLILEDREDRFDAYDASWVAIAASGTVSLELALARLPMITIYRTGALTAWLARRLIRVPHVNLVNLLHGRPVVPELLQEDCNADQIVVRAIRLIEDRSLREAQIAALGEVAAMLKGDDHAAPSDQAADKVLALLAERQAR